MYYSQSLNKEIDIGKMENGYHLVNLYLKCLKELAFIKLNENTVGLPREENKSKIELFVLKAEARKRLEELDLLYLLD
jgi:hypothetical protein